jgi:hypothetical protein
MFSSEVNNERFFKSRDSDASKILKNFDINLGKSLRVLKCRKKEEEGDDQSFPRRCRKVNPETIFFSTVQ